MATTIIEHDYPADVPVAIVVDCSSQGDVEAATLALLEEGITLVRSGDIAAGTDKIGAAQAAMDSITAPHTVTPLTDEEIAARQIVSDADTAAFAAAENAVVERQALVQKLAAGTAPPAETQSALAELLGGTPS